jgi:hypothetical protein
MCQNNQSPSEECTQWVPPVSKGGISPGQKWWRTVLERRNFMQPMGLLTIVTYNCYLHFLEGAQNPTKTNGRNC